MSKSTQVNVNVDGISLCYTGLAGKRLVLQPVFRESYDKLLGDNGASYELFGQTEHEPAIASYVGEAEVMPLMAHGNFIPTLMSCVGIHSASYILGVLQAALDSIGQGHEQDISISFTVFC